VKRLVIICEYTFKVIFPFIFLADNSVSLQIAALEKMLNVQVSVGHAKNH